MLLVCGVFDNHRRISLICLLLGLSWAFFSSRGSGGGVFSVHSCMQLSAKVNKA